MVNYVKFLAQNNNIRSVGHTSVKKFNESNKFSKQLTEPLLRDIMRRNTPELLLPGQKEGESGTVVIRN